jgi:hypothetical protein
MAIGIRRLLGREGEKLPIGKEQIAKALTTLEKYRQGKSNLENKILQNEKWYKIRHWECLRGGNANKKPGEPQDEVQPASAWLFNSLANKHADAMDNYPEPSIRPREPMDTETAKMLSSIIPVVLEQTDFEMEYSTAWMRKLKTGTGAYKITWDSSKLNGLGDISIKAVDLLNVFWEPGVTDIQSSLNLFDVEIVDNEVLVERYPELEGKTGGTTLTIQQYVYDESVDTSNKSAVIDWYYKKTSPEGKTILHYCKFCNGVVLFATENDPKAYPNGWYDHGLYPFVFDPLYPIEGTPTGFGIIDIGKDAQEYIDRGNAAFMENMLVNAKPRFFSRNDGSVNEEEYADITKDFVHFNGNMLSDSVIPIQCAPLQGVYVTLLQDKITELKETTGNRDVSSGGTEAGATAASAIAAMQEAGSKLSRDANKASYRAYRHIIEMTIELIRQFYDAPRQFRIVGMEGAEEFVQFSNATMGLQKNGEVDEYGQPIYRLPLFDVKVSAAKQSPYSKMAQNELALQLYSAGMFAPQNFQAALACVEMMDFDDKSKVIQTIQNNAMQYMAMMSQMTPPPEEETESKKVPEAKTSEPAITAKARARTAEATAPR